MLPPAGVENVGRDSHIEGHPSQAHAFPCQRQPRHFQVSTHLLDARIFQEVHQASESAAAKFGKIGDPGRFKRQCRITLGDVTEREIEGLAHIERQREADQTGPVWIEEGVVHPQRHPTQLTGPTNQSANVVRVDDQMAVDRRRPAHRRRRRYGHLRRPGSGVTRSRIGILTTQNRRSRA